jgi:hypothetical protein
LIKFYRIKVSIILLETDHPIKGKLTTTKTRSR